MSHHTAVVNNCLPHHRYLHHFHLPHCLLIAQVQEDVLGEQDVCGRQDDCDHWLAPSHDSVEMGGLSVRVMHQISQVIRTKAMLTQAIYIWWEANE